MCFLALIVISDAQPGQPQDKACPPIDKIVDGEPCGEFIPDNSNEASCLTSETEQCDCPGQENPDPLWICRNIGDDIDEDEDNENTPVSVDLPSGAPAIIEVDNEEQTSSPTPSVVTDECPPAEEIIDGESCGEFIPNNSQEASCLKTEIEQCNCAGQVDPNPVWVCRNIEDDKTDPPEPPQNCTFQVCDPSVKDQCTCRVGLECRQRQPGVYQCSQVSRTERNRISAAEQVGGAAGRDRRNREGLVSF